MCVQKNYDTLGTHDNYMKQLEPVLDTPVDFCAIGEFATPIAFRVILLTQWGQPATGILGVKS